ncbi:hypothetical protein VB774_05500 [Pseudanabaena galeata UHCC 0370]|uniref:Uncharacterized protein n=1 Tax=Pseudanabaena galeata UHCC 0370 TaxID=3110310 RepID=A0ABU5TFJ3_9CYAN|nr:hypothetical protein [Pseudanabaena galeata]MEA5477070.1 hypothetical protein [Pseudanabaena galeata UHCC 0370]
MEDSLLSFFKSSDEEEQKAREHEELRSSQEYVLEMSFLRKTIQDFIQTLMLCSIAASRSSKFSENYLLPRHFDDIVEAAMSAHLSIENGALNPARRELRHILEVIVNISYVDQVRVNDTFDQRISYYRGKSVKKSNVDHIFHLPLRLMGNQKESFAKSVQSAWVRASNYVHLTKKRVDEKLRLRDEGIVLGMETIEMLKNIVSEVHETCTITIILAFETIGVAATGDLLVDSIDEIDSWVFHSSEYVAIVDSYFDYKHERKTKLEEHMARRKERIKYYSTPASA